MRLVNRLRDIRTLSALLDGADAEAHAEGEDKSGAEHVMLSALALDEGSARRVFERIGADPHAVRAAIAAQHDEALRTIGIDPLDDATVAMPSGDPQAQRRLYAAAPSAQALIRSVHDLHNERKGSRLLGAHVVLAAAEMEHGTPARALRSMGIDRHALATAARQEIEAS